MEVCNDKIFKGKQRRRKIKTEVEYEKLLRRMVGLMVCGAAMKAAHRGLIFHHSEPPALLPILKQVSQDLATRCNDHSSYYRWTVWGTWRPWRPWRSLRWLVSWIWTRWLRVRWWFGIIRIIFWITLAMSESCGTSFCSQRLPLMKDELVNIVLFLTFL